MKPTTVLFTLIAAAIAAPVQVPLTDTTPPVPEQRNEQVPIDSNTPHVLAKRGGGFDLGSGAITSMLWAATPGGGKFQDNRITNFQCALRKDFQKKGWCP